MQSRELGGLRALVSPGDKNQGTLVLLHGYGAGCADLAPLADILAQAGPWESVFPDGTVEVEIGPHMMGRAWFAIDMMRLNMVLLSGRDNPYDDITPPGLVEAAAKIRAFLTSLGTPMEKIVLGGFSQGSMLALETALTLETPLAGLALLSCNKTSGERWSQLIREKGKTLKVFQSHGDHDPVLPLGSALRLADELQTHAKKHAFHQFVGGHEIPLPIVTELGAFLKEVF